MKTEVQSKTRGRATAQPDRRTALEGESYRSHGCDEVFTVQPKSEGSRGAWICMTCGTSLRNPMEKDTHCHGRATRTHMVNVLGSPARHVLAWLSFDSNRLEVP